MVRLKVPGRGRISIYNTHWCAGCPPEELEVHWQESFEFCNNVESFLPGESPVVFGGDLNLDRFRTILEGELYDDIVVDQGFTDAYADSIPESLDTLCNSELDDVDVHCTDDVTSFSPPSLGARRIDYIFIKNFFNVASAHVVFNEAVIGGVGPSVSDHAAVVTSLELP